MAELTPRLSLQKPLIGETDWGDEIRTSLDLVDAGVALVAHLHTATYAPVVHSHGSVTLPWADVTTAPYSAVGDGVNDDTAEIQAAIDAVGADGIVFFPAGRYKVSATLTVVNDNVMLLGAGPGEEIGATQAGFGTRIEAAAGLTGAVIRVQRAANDRPVLGTVIKDLAVDGNSIGSSVEGIHFRSNRAWIENVYVIDCTGNGIHVEGYAAWATYDTRIVGVMVSECNEAGIYCSTRGEDLHLTNCILFANQDGLRIQAASEQITACHFYDNTRYGVFFDNGGTRTKLANCKIEGNKAGGVRIETQAGGGLSDLQIVGCNFANNFDVTTNVIDELFIGGDANTGADRILVAGCSFTNKAGSDAAVKARYAANLSNGASRATTIVGCLFGINFDGASQWGTAAINNAASTTLLLKPFIAGNYGIKTTAAAWDARGTATIPNGATTVVVTHGLGLTPVASDITVTPTNNQGNASHFWVSTVGATTFTINADVDPGATTATYVWQARL